MTAKKSSRLRHQNDTQDFEGLTLSQQAKTISVGIINLERQVRARMRKAEREGKDKCAVQRTSVKQLARLVKRLDGPESATTC